MQTIQIGVLAFHGDVSEHIEATQRAAATLRLSVSVCEVRTKSDLKNLNGLIIPGGESPTLQKLCERENMWSDMKKIKNIFGTCAGAIMLSKKAVNSAEGQQTLGLMNIEIARNAYGRQAESFEEKIKTEIGSMEAIFIRAPKIKSVGKNVKVLARIGKEIVACEERTPKQFFLAATFHPELTTTKFHEHFLKQI